MVLGPVPVDEIPPGYLNSVHSPFSGIFSRRMFPVARSHVGCTMALITGGAGVRGWGSITAASDGGDMHPEALVTVNVYVPGLMPAIVLVVPVPLTETLPGVRVRVQVPVAGSPLSATLPVDTAQVGWVIVPMTGAEGVSGWALITTADDGADVQPTALVTVKVYDPGASPVTVVLEPVPVTVRPPGVTVIVHSPEEGRLFRMTLPAGAAQVGCVTVPGTGAAGIALTVRV